MERTREEEQERTMANYCKSGCVLGEHCKTHYLCCILFLLIFFLLIFTILGGFIHLGRTCAVDSWVCAADAGVLRFGSGGWLGLGFGLGGGVAPHKTPDVLDLNWGERERERAVHRL